MRINKFHQIIALCLKQAAMVLSCMLLLGTIAHGQNLINLSFYGGPGYGKAGPAAFGLSSSDYWNGYSRDLPGGQYATFGSIANLKSSTGTNSGVSMSISNAPGAWTTSATDPMMKGYLYPFDRSNIVLTISNLQAGVYDFYVYAHGAPDAENGVVQLSANSVDYGTKSTTAIQAWTNQDWVEGKQYVVFKSVNISGGQKTVFTIKPGAAGLAVLNGLQISMTGQAPGSAVQIVPNGGVFTNSVAVTMVNGLGFGVIRYTTDGSSPQNSSTAYVSGFAVTNTSTVRAQIYLNDFPVSEVFSAVFTKALPPPAVVFTPAGGLFTNSITVALSNTLNLGTIRYTLDGLEPVAGSATYTNALVLNETTTIRARVYVNGFPVSEVISASYGRVYAINDGISAQWRERYFGPGYLTDPRVKATADPDGDGASNLQEFIDGTDPTDPLSGYSVQIQQIPRITWSSVSNQTYRILRKPSLSSTNWIQVGANIQATNSVTHFIDESVAGTNAFYLVQPVQ